MVKHTRLARLERLANASSPLPVCPIHLRRCTRCPCPYDGPKLRAAWPPATPPRELSPELRARLNDDGFKTAGKRAVA